MHMSKWIIWGGDGPNVGALALSQRSTPQAMLEREPSRRIDALQAVNHPYFA